MLKQCAGRCSQEKSEEEFAWNRSGYSRRNRCHDCVTADSRDRTAAWRKSRRPADWTPKYKLVECLGTSHKCNKCEKIKSHDAYYEDSTAVCNFASKCKDCRKADFKEAYATNRGGRRDKLAALKAERTPADRQAYIHSQFVYRLVRDFHITEEQYAWLLGQQRSACALCFEPETKIHHRNNEVMRLAVDHDHRCCSVSSKSCGKCIRGLLCYSCNMMMGKIESKPALARRFADYVARRPLDSFYADVAPGA